VRLCTSKLYSTIAMSLLAGCSGNMAAAPSATVPSAALPNVPTQNRSGRLPDGATRSLHQRLTIFVPATQPYTDTGISVTPDMNISISATGRAYYSLTKHVGPSGRPIQGKACQHILHGGYPPFIAPGLACWSLFGLIGYYEGYYNFGTTFEVGKQVNYTVGTNGGELYLGFNDTATDFGDNSKGFTATITY
jgi:hypothetical protein